MIKQEFDVESYWKVIVYYNVDYALFSDISNTLQKAGAASEDIENIYGNMSSGKAKAVTYSNYSKHISIVLFNKHESMKDYINSIVHEAEHIKQAMLAVYGVDDEGEPPAYTIGFLVMKTYHIFRMLIKSK